MDFLNLLGASADTAILANGSFRKSYFDLPRCHWNRIKQAAIDLDDACIGPTVITIDDAKMKIYYQEVQPLDPQMEDDEVYDAYGMTVEQIQDKITNLVDVLHSLDYGHGDLHMKNIGFKDGRFYLLDHDTVYTISEGEVPWVKQWNVEAFDELPFDEFVDYDYDNWKSDWLA